MKYIITVSVFIGIITAVRVPPYWPSHTKDDTKIKQFHIDKYKTIPSEILKHSKPQVILNNRYNRHNAKRIIKHDNINQGSTLSNVQVQSDGWVPLVLSPLNYYQQPFPNNYKKQNYHPHYIKHNTEPAEYHNSYRNIYNPASPLNKNYRDDKTDEVGSADQHINERKPPKFERNRKGKTAVSDHEVPLDIPTKPIYPGEGKWAKKGLKHKLFISPHNYTPLEKTVRRPDGYDTFEEGERLFHKHQNNFGNDFQELSEKQQGQFTQLKPSDEIEEGKAEKEETRTHEDTNDEDESEEFVPTKLYTQVRRTENEEHLPSDPDEPRLREVIKDSKIHTVYTEEGYEDIAYDHAGHEKNAESQEGNKEFDEDVTKRKEKNIPKRFLLKKLINEEEDDSEPAGSHYSSPTRNKLKTNNKNFIKTKEDKMLAVKNKGNGTMELEISSEVKTLIQPNNTTKSHKYVKIYPKIHKYMKVPVDKTKKFSAVIKDETTSTGLFTTTSSYVEVMANEIPITTLPTTALPKMTVKVEGEKEQEVAGVIKNIDKAHNEKLKIRERRSLKSRRKRFANDFLKIEVDTDFIDRLNPNIPKIEKEDVTKVKYPFYNNFEGKVIDENSPLRYSENAKNIPKKLGHDLAFYKMAAEKVQCAEVVSTVDPIPERVKNAEERAKNMEETTDVAELAESPRLKGLGDKIDCFKRKYFGENPLDNPLFKEEFVGPIKSIFPLNNQQAVSNHRQHNLHYTEVENKEFPEPISPLKREDTNLKFIKDNSYEATNSRKESVLETVKRDANYAENEVESVFPAKSEEDINIIQNTNPKRIADEIYITTSKEDIEYGTFGESSEAITESASNEDHLEEMEPDFENSTASEVTEDATSNSQQQLDMVTTDLPVAQIEQISTERLGFNVLSDVITKINASKNEEQQILVTEASSISLITTPNYTIDLQPKHIYDQIKLLNYLPPIIVSPVDGNSTTVSETMVEDTTVSQNQTEQSNHREAKVLVNTEVVTVAPAEETNANDTLPESQALRSKRRRLRPRRPMIHIFDINKYLPTQKSIFKDLISPSSTVMPKYKVVSEVFYKDEIKPNEQLNVFADVINNIKNSSNDPLMEAASEYSNQIAVKLNTSKHGKIKIPSKKRRIKQPHQDSYLTAYGELENPELFASSTTTTMKPMVALRGKTKYKSHKNYEQFYEGLMASLQNKDNTEGELQIEHSTHTPMVNIRRRPTTSTTTESLQNLKDPAADVLGLMPPGNYKYKTILEPEIKLPNSIYEVIEDNEINKFIVPGMKPPLKNQKIYLYSDFKLANNYFKRRHGGHRRRTKRYATRPSYSDLSRSRNRPQAESTTPKEDDEDDYVPHRPKNYHYDEKTGRIVYDNVKQDKVEDENVEYIEVTEEPQTYKPVTTRKPIPTPDPNEPSLLFYLEKLRKDPKYIFIPDPTTTEKGVEATTEKQATTANPTEPTKPPEFLNILSKVRGDSNYKLIEEKKKASSTTTEAAIEEEEVIEESRDSVQNAPGGQNSNFPQNLEIFDINQFLPKVKNYSPRTGVDISKYKVIERPSLRHNMSSRYNSEKDKALEDVNTSRVPIVLEENKKEDTQDNPASESKHDKTPRSTSTTTTTTTTTSSSTTTTSTTSATTTTTTSIPKILTIATSTIRSRGRKRLTTTRPTTLSTAIDSATSSRSVSETPAVQQDKLKRNYRRRPTRIKIRTTTESILDEAEDDNTKTLSRRSETDTAIVNLSVKPEDQKIVSQIESTIFGTGETLRKLEPIVVDDNINEEGIEHLDTENVEEISNPDEAKPETSIVSEAVENVPKGDVEVFKDYDKTKKHGGNYRRKQEEEKKHNKPGKKQASNHKYEDEEVATEENEEKLPSEKLLNRVRATNIIASNRKVTKTDSEITSESDSKEIKRLTDVILKPDMYYTDPKLPKSINQLKEVDVFDDSIIPSDGLDETISNEEEIGGEVPGDYYDEVRISFGKSASEEQATSTTINPDVISSRNGGNINPKTPKIIKDPSERLYYYASV